MTLSRRTRSIVLVAALLVFALLLLRASLRAPERLTWLDRGVLAVVAPVERGGAWMGQGAGRFWSRYVALIHVESDNERLKSDNAQLQRALNEHMEDGRRIDELGRLLALRQRLHTPTRTAKVIASETSPFFRVLRVRLDLADGGEPPVAAGMAVLGEAGVVGRIYRVAAGYADVFLLTDPKSSIDVIDARTGSRGVAKGVASDRLYRARLDYLARTDAATEGDAIVTSGLDGAFPARLPVGRLVKVVRHDFGLYQDAELEPVVDFGRLRTVLILLVPPVSTPIGSPGSGQKSVP